MVKTPLHIAISSLAFLNEPLDQIIQISGEYGFTLEFSSGLPYSNDNEAVFLQAPIAKHIHNYFPAPKEPFVINLASKDSAIRIRSIQHCQKGLELAKAVGAPFYSAHAGFCIDPPPRELGQRLTQTVTYDRKEHWQIFMQSVEQVLQVAEAVGIPFLIENNVVAAYNMNESKVNPLLCATPEEIVRLFKELSHTKLGFLLDTAHLKVSARALCFDLEDAVREVEPFVQCIHHSDNDGFKDTNSPLHEQYWFLKHMKQFTKSWHVLEVKDQKPEQLQKQISLLQKSAG